MDMLIRTAKILQHMAYFAIYCLCCILKFWVCLVQKIFMKTIDLIALNVVNFNAGKASHSVQKAWHICGIFLKSIPIIG